MNDALDQLQELLRAERQALLGGDYEQLGDIASGMTRCLAALGQQIPEPGTLKKVKAEMSQNQQLIKAALDGVGTAQKRISALQSVRDALKTYDPSGNIDTVTTPRSSFEKKA